MQHSFGEELCLKSKKSRKEIQLMQLSSAQKGFLWIWDPTDFGDFGCGDAWGLLLPYITSVTVIIIITTTIIIIIWNIAASCLSDWK